MVNYKSSAPWHKDAVERAVESMGCAKESLILTCFAYRDIHRMLETVKEHAGKKPYSLNGEIKKVQVN